mgnify:CR=1 FL=1
MSKSVENCLLTDLIYDYVYEADAEARENANINYSASACHNFIVNKILAEYILEMFPEDVRKAHVEGDIHIHKLRDGGYLKPYCKGHRTDLILMKGLITPNIHSKPAKHFDTAIDHFINFLVSSSLESTGAVALNFIDLYLAPFVYHEKLTYKKVKQGVQRFIFNLNFTYKTGDQAVFSNINFGIGVKSLYDLPAYIDGKVVGKLGEYLDEALMIFKAFIEIYLEGDARGIPFTFPIPTIIFTKDFEKIMSEYPEIEEMFWQLNAKFGQFYFLNSYNEDKTNIYAFCCRLQSDISKVNEYLHTSRGVWAIPPSTGSINVVSINLPRCGFLAYDKGDTEKYVYDNIYERMLLARKTLQILRNWYIELFRRGLYPITKIYIDEFNPFKYFYNTIGLVGLPELVSIIINNHKIWYMEDKNNIEEIIKIERRILEFMNKVAKEFEEQDHVLYNIEQIPAESTAIKFAMLDYDRFIEYRFFIPSAGRTKFYSNMNTPNYSPYMIDYIIAIEHYTQKLYTGGVTKHFYFHTPLSADQLEAFCKTIIRNTDIVYFSPSPTVTECLSCGKVFTGKYRTCPLCGSENVEFYQKIVGYIRPLRAWSPYRREEFETRISIFR